MVTELSSSFTAARSTRPLFRKSAATSATGSAPAGYEVLGKGLLAPPGLGVNADVAVLPESSDRVTGKRSPTKNDAGLPSCARRRTWRPLCTSERASEKSAAAPGSVRRNVVFPPPTATSGGIKELIEVAPPDPLPKMPARSVWSAERLFAWVNWLIRLGGMVKSWALEGVSIPSFRAVLRSTSSSSISSITSPRALSVWRINSPATARCSGVSRMVMVRLRESSSMCVAPVMSRSTRSISVTSSGPTAAGRGKVCSASSPNCLRFSKVS